jgi:hypothetical protein
MAEAERLRQSLLADAGRGDLLKTIIDRVELRPNGLRMILSLVPLTPAAAPPNRLQGCVFTREFPLRIKCRGVEMRFAIDGVSVAAEQKLRFKHHQTGRPGCGAVAVWRETSNPRFPYSASIRQGLPHQFQRASCVAIVPVATLSKNWCLPTVPTEALRRLWVDSGPSPMSGHRRGRADPGPSRLSRGTGRTGPQRTFSALPTAARR